MDTYYIVWQGWFVLSACIALALVFIRAPYGRHIRSNWGPTLGNKLGWMLMEAALIVFLSYYALQGYWRDDALALGPWQWMFYLMMAGHYVYRAFLFPLRIRTPGKRMPWLIAGMAVLHNWGNGYLNGYYLSHADPRQWSLDTMLAPHAIAGVCLFVAGFAMHYSSDGILIRLRKPGETGYKIPQGGMFRLVSSPNYLGELLEWLGFALLTMSPGAWAFLAFTSANLVPRAVANHKWYRETFPEYPKERKAILPGLF